ncbi:phosphoglucosamine mutase [Fodinisporobacter ferrooxydans]|uniref:Phosphoglucosamine mutase n=1 Tax=Fodinisporobacter ferrooxydans TaxID=2901836 RepID=A0ABY4CRA0_9BACL|nr:phosphoglucosamine mutase [Alicyclobacillaceae bacterium MYW30-H2]
MGRLFGTDGVRGVANTELSPELAFRLGRIGAYVLARGKKQPFIIVGKDTRASGDLLEAALTAGILSAGANVWRVGVVSTPAVAYLTRYLNADAGVMISASHNPVQDNGIKFFGGDGFKLLDSQEDEIERFLKEQDTLPRPIGAAVGRVYDRTDAVEFYKKFLIGTVRNRFEGMTVILDCGNGAAYDIGPDVFRRLGANVIVRNGEPDGSNINVQCGSTHPEVIQQTTVEQKAQIGLSFDGDADRLIACDENGDLIDGDYCMAICGQALKERGELVHTTIVTTVMSNVGFIKAAEQLGIQVVRTSVGDRYVMEAMREGGYILGGEQSGHIIFLQHNTTGDGVLTALQLTDILVEKKQPMSELRTIMKTYPQVMINVRVQDKMAWRHNPSIQAAIAEVERALGGDGRVLVRESGTEPLVRVMAEGPDVDTVRQYVENIVTVIRQELGK